MSKINHAVVTVKAGEAKVVESTVPKLRDDYILVKVKAVALNPTDWKHVAWLTDAGSRIGCDYAGIVEEVGSKVTKNFKKGDRVSGFVHVSHTMKVLRVLLTSFRVVGTLAGHGTQTLTYR